MAMITAVHARQILDSRGNPTVEVEVLLETTLAEARRRIPATTATLTEAAGGVAMTTRAEHLDGMARMLAELELMRSVVEAALEAIDAGRSDLDQAVSLAKATASDTLKLVTRETVQLHGGIGMTDEHDAGLYLKRAAVLEQMWGTAAFHRERFARLNGY